MIKIKVSIRWFLIIVLAVAAFLIAFLVPSEKATFDIEDKCGRFVNLESHTIEDSEACSLRCRSQCQTLDYSFKNSDFIKNATGCNRCICRCK